VSKLSFTGATLSLAYSTYLGGSLFDEGAGIAVDLAGNAYVVGQTISVDFPTTHPLATNAAMTINRGVGGDAFVVKLGGR
jgi:hypothetical protein